MQRLFIKLTFANICPTCIKKVALQAWNIMKCLGLLNFECICSGKSCTYARRVDVFDFPSVYILMLFRKLKILYLG